METTGYIHSIDSFGSVDGPGVRFVTFSGLAICGAGIALHKSGYMEIFERQARSEQQISENAAHANTVKYSF